MKWDFDKMGFSATFWSKFREKPVFNFQILQNENLNFSWKVCKFWQNLVGIVPYGEGNWSSVSEPSGAATPPTVWFPRFHTTDRHQSKSYPIRFERVKSDTKLGTQLGRIGAGFDNQVVWNGYPTLKSISVKSYLNLDFHQTWWWWWWLIVITKWLTNLNSMQKVSADRSDRALLSLGNWKSHCL